AAPDGAAPTAPPAPSAAPGRPPPADRGAPHETLPPPPQHEQHDGEADDTKLDGQLYEVVVGVLGLERPRLECRRLISSVNVAVGAETHAQHWKRFQHWE